MGEVKSTFEWQETPTCHNLILKGGEAIEAVSSRENPFGGDDRAAAEVGDAHQEVSQRHLVKC